MKLLLYCVKAKPYLYKTEKPMIEKKFRDYHTQLNKAVLNQNCLNGKIVAECDFEVDKLTNCGTSFMIMKYDDLQESYRYTNEIARGSCLDYTDLRRYLGTNNGYAIHIKNLHIFDKPRELDFYSSNFDYFKKVEKAPQNMMKVWEDQESPRVLISIRPEWLCKILNGEKTIEVRKKVLKKMLK